MRSKLEAIRLVIRLGDELVELTRKGKTGTVKEKKLRLKLRAATVLLIK